MKVAIIHSHFRRGGVTRVVENAVAGLEARGIDCLALSGEAYDGDALPHHRIIEGLGYENTHTPGAGKALARCLMDTATETFGGAPDLWHIHNHSLGKNLNFPEALHVLARNGARLLLQIHDFAEDGRPTNYERLTSAYPDSTTFAQSLYPSAPQIHYAALNQRDARILRETGLASDQLHILPNSVAVPQLEASGTEILPAIEQLILYPTRAIRRKNVGELLLHAALAPAGTHFATTLIPQNPEWFEIHRFWETLATELKLPVTFGLGESYDFAALIQRADALITTSVAEGFGLAFLEPALFGKPLVGRNLPEITADFRAWGIELKHLYPELPVPAEAVDETHLRTKIALGLQSNAQAYHRPLPANATESALNATRSGDGWDFGRLDEALQADVIRYALEHPERFSNIHTLLLERPTPGEIASERKAIETHLNLDHYGEKLHALYKQILSAPVEKPTALNAEAIVSSFLDPRRLSLLRV